MGLSRAINKLSFISKLKLLESLDKNGEINKVYVAATSPEVWNSWFLTFLDVCLSNAKILYVQMLWCKNCFAAINSVAVIILKTINNTRADFFRKHIFEKWYTNLDGVLKITFNLQYGKVLPVAFSVVFLISNDATDVLPRNEKVQTNSFFGTIQIFGCLIDTSLKHIFMEWSKKFLG